jgi:S-adenosylmethionine decarboxylase
MHSWNATGADGRHGMTDQRFDPAALGHHLIIDLIKPKFTADAKHVDCVLRNAVRAVGARLLALEVHGFGAGAGVTGVAVLAESHLSFHSWPERDYAALDMFVCGGLDPSACLPVLQTGFDPDEMRTRLIVRGG